MRITVLCFAELAESLGTGSMSIELEHGADVERALAHLAAAHPAIEARHTTLAIAVNERYATRTQVLDDGDTVALIGPVSGG